MVDVRLVLARFLRERSGATAIENALLMGAIGAAALVGFNYFADDMKATFMGAGKKIEAAGSKPAGPVSRTGVSGKSARD